MNNGFLKSMNKKRDRVLLSIMMVLVMIFSLVPDAFATAAWPGSSYVTSVSFEGGDVIQAVVPGAGVTNGGQFLSSSFTEAYKNVPVDTTFTITTNMGRVFLHRGSWDPDAGTFSTTIMNRDLVQIQDSNGNVIPDVKVSNLNDPDKLSEMDTNIQVHPEKPLNYDTNYKLVVKKYFSKSNQTNPPSIRGAIPEDVVIPFKTAPLKTVSLEKPTITKAELRGSTLRLEGLVKDKKLEYNFALDGNFDNANWKAFDYTDDTANIEVSDINLTGNSKIMVGYTKDDNSVPTDISDPISVLYASASAPSLSRTTFVGGSLSLRGVPKGATNIEYQIAADGQNYSEWKNLILMGDIGYVHDSSLNIIVGQSIVRIRYKANPPWPVSETVENVVEYDFNATIPLTQGKDINLIKGIKISPVSLDTPGEGEVNTIVVEYGEGEHLHTPYFGIINNGIYAEDNTYGLRSCGGVYKFYLVGAGNGDNNHVKITIPFQLPITKPSDIPDSAVIDSSKVGMYMLKWVPDIKEYWEYWQYVPATINPDNTATIDITGFNAKAMSIILNAKYDWMSPKDFSITPQDKTPTSLSFNVSAHDGSGIKEMVVKRVNRADSSDVKTITLSYKDYPDLANPFKSKVIFTDDTPQPGVNYDYILTSVTDALGNRTDSSTSMCSAAIDVTDPVPSNIAVTGLNLNKTSTSVQLGKNITLTATVLPDNATNKKVTWRSSNPDVATVDQAGKVTGIKEGTAIITATTEDGSIAKQCEVTVVIDECFIATAAYGSKFQPAVVLLRHFRDDYLLTNTIGSAFVKFYYKNSPPIANFIAHNVALKNTVKVLLTPFVGVVYGLYHPVLGGTVLLVISLLILVRRRYKPQSKL